MENQEKIVYPYSVNFTLADDETAIFEVGIVSSATTATTSVPIPESTTSIKIMDNGSQKMGTGKQLTGKTVTVRSILTCPAKEVDKIEVNYQINGKPIVEHMNLTSEQDRPRVDIAINFTKS